MFSFWLAPLYCNSNNLSSMLQYRCCYDYLINCQPVGQKRSVCWSKKVSLLVKKGQPIGQNRYHALGSLYQGKRDYNNLYS